MVNIFSYKDKSPEVHSSCFVAPNVTLVGDVEIGSESSIWFGSTLRGDVSYIKIGERTNIQDHSMIHESSRPIATIIGDDVTVGHCVLLHACTIESGSFVGMKSCIMDGAILRSGSMLAAGSLLTPGKEIPSGELWAGSPATFMRHLTDEDYKHIKWSANHYVELAKTYLETK
jgi:carbonic anhydrase/acetyltransferase-like protein (isoleucine patch superfamily)